MKRNVDTSCDEMKKVGSSVRESLNQLSDSIVKFMSDDSDLKKFCLAYWLKPENLTDAVKVNPAVIFSKYAKCGDFDNLSDSDYANLLDLTTSAAEGWNDSGRVSFDLQKDYLSLIEKMIEIQNIVSHIQSVVDCVDGQYVFDDAISYACSILNNNPGVDVAVDDIPDDFFGVQDDIPELVK